MRAITLSLLLLALACPVASAADESPPPCEDSVSAYSGNSDRVREIEIAGRRVLVLLPPDYARSGRRYPVLYLLHGSENTPDAWLVATDLVDFTWDLPDDQQAIVIMPDGGLEDWWVDWRRGEVRDETLFTAQLVPAIDAAFRTSGARTIAGFSLGGYAAAFLTARHPELFRAFASFSGGPFDLDHPGGQALAFAAPVIVAHCSGHPESADPFSLFGDPVTDRLWYRNASPVHLAPNFTGVSVSLYVGNGVPCPDDPPLGPTPKENPAWWIEAGAREQADRLSAALNTVGIAHLYEVDSCGAHTYTRTAQRLRAWWPRMLAAAPPPPTFDFRSAEEAFAVRGFAFRADPGRAPEFLEIDDASCAGLRLTGSGVVTVRTPACAPAVRTVRLGGAREQEVTSRSDGTVEFTVDLGTPNPHQQYGLMATAFRQTQTTQEVRMDWQGRGCAQARLSAQHPCR